VRTLVRANRSGAYRAMPISSVAMAQRDGKSLNEKVLGTAPPLAAALATHAALATTATAALATAITTATFATAAKDPPVARVARA